MATNNFKPFGIGAGANVTSQSDYEALAALLTGFQSGKASSAQINKALRQSTVMAYVLAQFISDSSNVDVLDNGIPANILTNFKAGFTKLTPGRLLNIQYITATGTYTKTPGTMKGDVIAIGAGAGGGYAISTQNYNAAGGGGGSGGMARKFVDLSSVNTVSCTIGVGGTGGIASSSTAAASGGTTTFGTYLSAAGGAGANSAIASSSSSAIGAGGTGGLPTIGDLLVRGGIGQAGISSAPSNVGTSVSAGPGGQSFLGGYPGYGAGGNGAQTAGSTQSINGQKGSDGIIIIMEYA